MAILPAWRTAEGRHPAGWPPGSRPCHAHALQKTCVFGCWSSASFSRSCRHARYGLLSQCLRGATQAFTLRSWLAGLGESRGKVLAEVWALVADGTLRPYSGAQHPATHLPGTPCALVSALWSDDVKLCEDQTVCLAASVVPSVAMAARALASRCWCRKRWPGVAHARWLASCVCLTGLCVCAGMQAAYTCWSRRARLRRSLCAKGAGARSSWPAEEDHASGCRVPCSLRRQQRP